MKRDRYLEDLAKFLHVVTGPQLLSNYFDNSISELRRVLRQHEAKGLLTTSVELVRTHQRADRPITIINCGNLIPSASEIARAARNRWLDKFNPILTIRATAKLCSLVGGQQHVSGRFSVSHDIALSDVFFSKRSNPEFNWELTHSRPGQGALPDAVCAEGAVEVVGNYNSSSLRAKLAISRSMNLELW